jgi:DNA-binding beta-propeller fold protein YncE
MRIIGAALATAVLAPVGAASAVTVTVGRQSLTGFTDYFHCQGGFSTNCDNSFSSTTLTTPGDVARVPADGRIVAWRVVGACVLTGGVGCGHELRVLRPNGGNFTFVSRGGAVQTSSTCDRCPPLDGSKIDISPALAVQAGDYIGLSEEAIHDADVRVMTAAATGAAYNVFAGLVNDGASVSPIPSANWEPLFNADVVLDAPLVSGSSPNSGATTGGQIVTITGDHLAGASQVRFGGVAATSLTVISTNQVRAVTPAHAAGTVDVTVTTPGGTSALPSPGQFTFLNPPAGGAGGSAYVANGADNNVWSFDIADAGLLRGTTPAALPAGTTPWGVAIGPDGRSLYVTNVHSQNVSQYTIGPGGLLTPKTHPTVAAGLYPFGIAVSPDGRSVYVTNGGDANVEQYDVGPGGELTAKTQATVPASGNPRALAISPDGHSVYVPNANTNDVSQFDVAAGGGLTPKTPATQSAGFYPDAIAVSPDGQSVYVGNSLSSTVSQYDVGSGGRLTPKTPPAAQAGSGPDGIVVSPDGRNVYVTNYTTNNVSQFDVDTAGRLTPKTPPAVPAGTSPSGVAVTPDGRSVYVTNSEDGTISQYAVGLGGRLTSNPTQATAAAGQEPQGIVLRPDQGPIAAFTVTVGAAGSASRFDASASRDPDGSVARYDWDFGDGVRAANAGPRPEHRYLAAAKYTATLTVADGIGCATSFVFTGQTALCNGGAAARTTRTLTVMPPSSGRRKPPPKADLRRSESTIRVNRKGRFTFHFRATPHLRGKVAFASVRKVRVSRKALVSLARKPFRVPAGGKVALRITLSRNNLRILKLNRTIRARVTVVLKDAVGLSSTASKLVAFKRPA